MSRHSSFLFALVTLSASCCDSIVGQTTTFTLQEATVQNINEAFDSGLLTSERLVELYLNRIEAYDMQGPEIGSIITLNTRALETARALDVERATSGPRSPLHGIPVLIKDNLDTFDMPTTFGSVVLKDSIPPDDGFIVNKLREAGAIILGKSNLDEFGCCSFGLSSFGGQTRNPYDPRRIPGGSSSGTAAAIAANFAVLGTGSDWWGSIQEPASLNSLVGLMPTRGLVSKDGSDQVFATRGAIGPIARTVADAAAMLDVIAGMDPDDPATAASEGHIPDSYLDALTVTAFVGARIGLVSNFLSGATPEVRDLSLAATDRMASLGAEIISVNIPMPTNLEFAYYADQEFAFNRYLETLGPDAPVKTLGQIVNSGNWIPSLASTFDSLRGDIAPEDDPGYASVVAVRGALELDIVQVMESEELDALVFPPLLADAPSISSGPGNDGLFESIADFRNMLASPFLGFPSITVPMGFRQRTGMPIGIEFLGTPFSEPELLSFAYAFEQATQHRMPPLSTPPLLGETVPEPSGVSLGMIVILALTLLRTPRTKRHALG